MCDRNEQGNANLLIAHFISLLTNILVNMIDYINQAVKPFNMISSPYIMSNKIIHFNSALIQTSVSEAYYEIIKICQPKYLLFHI